LHSAIQLVESGRQSVITVVNSIHSDSLIVLNIYIFMAIQLPKHERKT